MSTISQSLSKRQKTRHFGHIPILPSFSRQIFSKSKQMNSSVLTNFSRQILSKIKTKTLNSVF